MSQLLEYVDLADELLLFFLAHFPVVELFPYEHAAVALPADFVHLSEAALANEAQFFILIHYAHNILNYS